MVKSKKWQPRQYDGFFLRCVACDQELSKDQHTKNGLCTECNRWSVQATYPDYLEGDLIEMQYKMWREPLGGEHIYEDVEKVYNGESND